MRLIIFMLMLISTMAMATDFNGYGGVTLIYDNDGDKLSTELTHFAMNIDDKSYNVYGKYNFDDSTIDLVEAYAKFRMYDLDFQVGRMVRPFGINFLDRPESSVFISVPKYDSYAEGVNMAYQESYIIVEGFYSSDNIYDFRVKLELFDDGLIPSVSYNSNTEVLVSNELYYRSLVFNFSNLFEWNVDNGDFWTRCVMSPGIVNQIGVMFSYYNSVEENNIPNYDFTPDSWTVGSYIDLNSDTTISAEYKIGEKFTPLMFSLITKF